MASLKEIVFRMVAAKELTADQALALIARVQASPRTDPGAASPRGWPPVAVIGLSGRFPGAADVNAFWTLLRAGKSAITEATREGWNLGTLYDPRPQQPGKTTCKWGGFLPGIDEFDAAFFQVSPREAEVMDPQQRILLEEAWKAMEDAGYADRSLSGTRCGVFVGVGAGDYIHRLTAEGIAPDGYAFMGNANSILAARISYLLNLKGPCLAVDTACSSSLTAIHLACESLFLGTSDLALAGGVCLLNTSSFFLAGGNAGMLSPTGQCRTFDRNADGFVPGEAAAVVVLKPLEAALRDGDSIYGVIEGSAINQDGQTNGITAPSAPSQTALERDVYERFSIDPRTISYVEAHGTGTRLGDPIEIEALTRAFRHHTDRRQFCAIGSVKTNVGHTMSAAGVVSLIKVLLAFRHRQLPPSLHFEHENPAIEFEQTPFFVPTSLQDWQPAEDGVRRAAVSSFGFSGTNVHLVLREPPALARPATSPAPYLLTLSARTPTALQTRVAELERWLRAQPLSHVDLQAVCTTCNLGRSHFECRAAWIVHEVGELLDHLSRFPSGGTPPVADPETTPLALAAAAEQYRQGGDPDWRAIYPVGERRPVSLPTYPFERRRFSPSERTRIGRLTGLHPLIDRSLPSSETPSFAATLTPSLLFLRDHIVHGQAILPGACLIEMATAALAMAQPDHGIERCEDIVFLQPVTVTAAANTRLLIQLQRDEPCWKFTISDEDDPSIVHVRGRMRIADAATDLSETARFDRQTWLETPRQFISCDALYAMFQQAGVQCGPFCQGIVQLWLGDDDGLAELSVPATETGSLGLYQLHPTLLDGAFQAAMAWLAHRLPGSPVLVPFAVGELTRYAPLPATCYAYVKVAEQSAQAVRLHIAILDESGRLLVRIQDFQARALTQTRLVPMKETARVPCYRPVWIEQPAPAAGGPTTANGLILIVGDECDFGLAARLARRFSGRVFQIRLGRQFQTLSGTVTEVDRQNPQHFEQVLSALPAISAVYFLGGLQETAGKPLDLNEVEIAEQRGVYSLLRLVKVLQRSQFAAPRLLLTVVTNNVQAVLTGDRVAPLSAGLVGLTQTIARERPNIDVRLLDFTAEDLQTADSRGFEFLVSEPDSGQFTLMAYRQGRRFVRALELVELPEVAANIPLRHRGTYVILGGAGGLGLTFARHLAANYQANVLLIGRRELSASQQTAIHDMGGSVRYVAADITDRAALSAAFDEVRQRWGSVQGVIHAAMVLQDRSLASLDEGTFAAVLRPKVQGTIVAADLLRNEPLDFFVLFSSANAFFGNVGQANYASASTFQDALGLYLLQTLHLPVRVVNWGMWGEVGAVASAHYIDKAAQLGVGAMTCAEGVRAFEQILQANEVQVMPMKVEPAVLQGMGLAVRSTQSEASEFADIRHVFAQVEQFGRDLLLQFFQRSGVLETSGRSFNSNELYQRLAVIPAHRRLCDACLDILSRDGWLVLRGDRWFVTERALNPEFMARIDRLDYVRAQLAREAPWTEPFLSVLEICLERYPDLLRGKVSATEVLFGQATRGQIERLYRENPIADYFNRQVACAVAAALAGHDWTHRPVLRVLEIGAGTGGTTGGVLDVLARSARQVEYHYTDLSSGLVLHGKQRFGERYAFVQFGLLNIEQDPAAQNFELGSFDIVLAANVLHATRNIQQTTHHARQLLCDGGVLILNEATARQDFSTLTFGLTEGWWRFEDGPRRLPHSPLLNEEGWRRLLAEEGFDAVQIIGGKSLDAPQGVLIAPLFRSVAGDSSIGKPSRDADRNGLQRPSLAGPNETSNGSVQGSPLAGQAFVIDCLRQQTALALNQRPAEIPAAKAFAELGVDSIVGVDLVQRINRTLGLTLPSTVLFDFPNLSALAGHISSAHADQLPLASRSATLPTSRRLEDLFVAEPTSKLTAAKVSVSSVMEIAVVGLAGRFPGAANAREFWENLKSGVCSIQEVPPDRWDVSAYYDPKPGQAGKSPCKWGAFLDGIDQFDPLFFQMSGAEAQYTDPQHRLFLETAWHALEDAGYADRWLEGKHCGVYVGVGAGDYLHPLLATQQEPDPYAFLGNGVSILAARLSYLLNLRGPALAVDTACSSSLVAVHLACQSLQRGECELALAGGVFLSTSPSFHYLTGRLGMLSPTGECRAFDDEANGFVPGEAVGVVVLRPLADALRDGDQIYGVLRSTGINQDGRSNGLTAPNATAQSELIQDVYRQAGIEPATIDYVETHGTGTRLGDPIEFDGLARAFDGVPPQRCAIGSVKTNIGHPGPAAGIAGLIKVLLALRHQQLPASLNFATPNRHLRLEGSPFFVNHELRAWDEHPERPRRAAISSFGLSGTNAHVVVEESPFRPELPSAVTGNHLFTFSARTDESLQQRLDEFSRWLQTDGAFIRLDDIACTLNAGRSHFECRVAIVARSRDELLQKLNAVRQRTAADDCFLQLERHAEWEAASRLELQTWIDALAKGPKSQRFDAETWRQMARWYVRGHDIPWEQIYQNVVFQRVSLPGYPFLRQRYWLPIASPALTFPAASAAEPRRPVEPHSLHYFQSVWQSSPTCDQSVSEFSSVLVFDQSSSRVAALKKSLVKTRICWAQAGPAYGHLSADNYTLSAYATEDYERLLRDLAERGVFPQAILIFDWLEAADGAASVQLLQALCAVARGLARTAPQSAVQVLVFHTEDAEWKSLVGEASSGLSSSLPQIHPLLRWRTVQLESIAPSADELARMALSELCQPEPAPEVRYRSSGREERRFVALNSERSAPTLLRTGGVYWVSGGSGALGRMLARYLARNYGAHVILSSRRPVSAAVKQEFTEFGRLVEFREMDVTDAHQVQRVYEEIRQKHGALNGVIHAAGSIGPALLPEKSDQEIERTLSVKCQGAVLLDEVTREAPLDFFALYSSLAGILGDFGQCDYAVANRYLDAFAERRAQQVHSGQRRGKTMAIDWPLWADGGMHFDADQQQSYLASVGWDALSTAAGLQAFERCLTLPVNRVAVLSGDLATVSRVFAGNATETKSWQRPSPPPTLSVPQAEMQAFQLQLRGMISELLKLPEQQLGLTVHFHDFGLDSLNMKLLADEISERFQLRLSPTVFFEYETIAALSDYLVQTYGLSAMSPISVAELKPLNPPNVAAAVEPFSHSSDTDSIAIIGFAGRFPQSRDLDEFWNHLAAERDLISEAPADRWDWRQVVSHENDSSVARWGGFLSEIDQFDAGFFNLSPREAAYLDPRARLLLETVWETWEAAGYRPSQFAKQPVGVFVGCQANEYLGLIGDAGDANPQAVLGNTQTMLANRVSFLFDFRGPSESIDTACSSSLVAVHRAVRALQTGECSLAIAGGVSVLLSPQPLVLGQQLGMLSPRGRCRTFDRSADGYVKGEGVGAVLLKPLRQALADGDLIHGVIRASGVNHGGHGSFLTAPNPDAQAQLLIDTYARAGIDPATITYIEAHGTGTELGDPIEVDALRRAFQQSARTLQTAPYCGLGTVKSNIGHLEPAAGIASLIKMLLALRHRQLPATLHVQDVNPYLPLDGSPFSLVTRTQAWNSLLDEQGRSLPLRAGISSFGFGGTNAHLVLEESPSLPSQRSELADQPELILISAKTAERLKAAARRLCDFVSAQFSEVSVTQVSFRDLAFTLRVGREAMTERLALLARSPQDLAKQLADWLAGKETATSLWRGTADEKQRLAGLFDTAEELSEYLRGELAKGRRDKLARLWVQGTEFDVSLLPADGCRRVLLPTYPFARERHWFDAKPARPVIHPTESVMSAGKSVDEVPLPLPLVEDVTPPSIPTVSKPIQADEVERRLREMFAAALYLNPEQVDPDAKFADLGLDSILAVELAKAVKDQFQVDLRATRFYDYPTLRDLARFLTERPIALPLSADSPGSINDNGTRQPEVEGGDGSRTWGLQETPGAFDEARFFEPSVLEHSPPLPSPLPRGGGEGTKRGVPVQEHTVEDSLYDRLRQLVSDAVGLESGQIDEGLDLLELGVELVAAERLASRIQREWGVEFRGPELLSSPGLRQLAQAIQVRRGAASQSLSNAAHTVSSVLPAVTDIAIIGMSGRFPGADNLDEFWSNLSGGVDSVTDVPAERWRIADYYDPTPGTPFKTYCKRGGYLTDIDRFDPLFFAISPQEAEVMDPQQRLFLEEAWKAIENAGYADTSLSNQSCAVFVGAGPGDYQSQLAGANSAALPQLSIGNVNSILAARLAYVLNLKGAAVAIDTACSSSLVALHLACQALRQGECDLALAGGVCVLNSPQMHVLTSQARMLSPGGTCKAFDHRADGFVPAEGVGVVVLKRLTQAMEEGDTIHAVIRGSGINQDGKTNGITAPNARSQAELQRAVYERFDIDPATITLVETHGTGTKLGDPIEIEALTEAFRPATSRQNFCGIGSVKSNLGHALPASGIAGLLKVVLALRHRQLPPTLHCERENEHIDFARSPFYVIRELQTWQTPEGQPRRAAINSFGFSGTNAHVVLEEPPFRAAVPTQSRPAYLLTLSAKSEEALRRKIVELKAWLSRTTPTSSMDDLSFTLNVGRSHFRVRTAVVAATLTELIDELRRWRSGAVGNSQTMVSASQVDEALRCISSSHTEEKGNYRALLQSVADGYVQGQTIDWTRLHPRGTGRRIPLPTYPFEKRRCWVDASAAAIPHPLFDEVRSGLFAIECRKMFSVAEPVLRDHVVQGTCVLPGAASLEMVRAALESQSGSSVRGLHHVVWRSPFQVTDQPREVRLRIRPHGERAQFELFSLPSGVEVVHVQGEVELGPRPAAVSTATPDFAKLINACSSEISGQEFYERFRGVGIEYGPSYQLLRWVRYDSTQAIGRFELPAELAKTLPHLGLHPSIVDAALQTTLSLIPNPSSSHGIGLGLPFALDRVLLDQPLEPTGYVQVRHAAAKPARGDSLQFDLSILNDAGQVLVRLEGLTIRLLTALRRASESSSSAASSEGELKFLRLDWEPQALETAERRSRSEGSILIIRSADDFGISSRLAAHHASARVIEVTRGSAFRHVAEHRWELDFQSSGDCEALWRELSDVSVIYFLGGLQAESSLDLDAVAAAQQSGIWTLFRVIRSLPVRQEAAHRIRLCVVTNDAQPVTLDGDIIPQAASLIGFVRVLSREFSHLDVVCVDVSRCDVRSAEFPATIAAIVQESGETPAAEIAYRRGQRYVKRLLPAELPAVDAARQLVRRQGVYVLVGGAGGVGSTIAEFLASRDSVRLAIIGRRPMDEAIESQLSRLSARGSEAVYFSADVTNESALRSVRDEILQRWGAIHGVIHAGFVLSDRTIARMDEIDLETVLAPKIQGSCVLAKVFQSDSLDWMVFFSSMISLTANAGQANYVAASQFQDAFALRLSRQLPGRVRVINWGYFGGIGRVAAEPYRQRAERLGVASITPSEAQQIFAQVLTGDLPQVAVVKVLPDVLDRPPESKPVERHHETSHANNGLWKSNGMVRATAQRLIRESILLSLKLREDELENHTPLEQYGVDSLVATEIISRLSRHVGSLPPTVLFDYGTVEELAEFLATRRSESASEVSAVAAPISQPTSDDSLPIPLCTTGQAPTSFWVHSVVGEYGWAVRLSRHLGDNWPVYAFQMRDAACHQQSLTSLEQLAAAYVAQLRRVQPAGPYVLGGYSYGGTLAFEMARQLEQSGDTVSWLILLDALAPGSDSLQELQRGAEGTTALVQAAANLLALQWIGRPLLTDTMLDSGDREMQTVAAARLLHEHCPAIPSLDEILAALRSLMDTMDRHARLLEEYQPTAQRSEMRTLLLRNTEGFVGESRVLGGDHYARIGLNEPDYGWGRWLKTPPQIVEIPSNHFSLGQEPAIGLVAKAVIQHVMGEAKSETMHDAARAHVFAVLRQKIQDVLPDVPVDRITPDASLRDLGANSIDRVEIANAALEELQIDIPRTALGGLSSLGALIDLLCTHWGSGSV